MDEHERTLREINTVQKKHIDDLYERINGLHDLMEHHKNINLYICILLFGGGMIAGIVLRELIT